MPREKPILFSGPMVLAILDGRKSQTRRTVDSKFHPDYVQIRGTGPLFDPRLDNHRKQLLELAPFQVGERLWVRETWGVCSEQIGTRDEADALEDARSQLPWASILYRADANGGHAESHLYRWRPSIFMPRWACRIFLEVTEVRVERLQAITETDAHAEGVLTKAEIGLVTLDDPTLTWGRDRYRALWDEINGKRQPWSANPFCWVICFRRV